MANKVNYLRFILLFTSFLVLFAGWAVSENGHMSGGNDMAIGMPFGGTAEEPDLDLCPVGADVIGMFLAAWQKGDFKAMYDLLDEGSKEGYPFQQAKFDFQLLKFKPYKISSVRKSGENFEFILSYGDWKEGDKDLKKMIISGRTFRIIMSTRSSPFKKSAEDYF